MDAFPSFLMRGRSNSSEFELPWYLDEESEEAQRPTAIADWRLYHYLASGGIRAFANSTMRMIVRRRQNRFLGLAGGLMVLWVVFRFV